MKRWKKVISGLILCISILLVFFTLFQNRLEAAEDGDMCWTNFSNIAVSSKTGCNAQSVYQNCTFYSNFWNPNGNIQIRSVTVKLLKGSTTVFNQTKYSSDSNHYFNYVSIPITISEAGTYTVERSFTTLSGSTGTFDSSTLTVRDVSLCGTTLSATQTSVSLDMTGVYSKEITMSISGIRPKTSTISYSCSNSNVSCSWGGWYDADGDGSNESNDLMITGKVGGTTTITISFKDTNTGTVITTKNINVTIGPSYTISYNANGGSGAPSSQTKTYGNSLTLSNTKPTRSGYEFVGWSTSSSATSATYSSGATYTSNASTTLYAVWVKLANTMSIGTCYATSITSAGEYKYYKFVPISSGEYSFVSVGEEDTYGYLYDSKMNQLTSNDDGGEDYNCKITYSLTAGSTYYYAVKMYSSSVTGSFNTSIGKSTYEICYDENAVTTIVEVEYGSYHKIQAETIEQTGYTFLGWSTSSSDTSPKYVEGFQVINLDATGGRVYLYPVWRINKYTVQYDANGGSGAPSSQIKTYGQTLTLSSTKPTRSGYTFLGWSTSNSATSATYSSGGSYTTNSNVTLYAVWSANTYTVSYNANGGSGAPSSQIKTYGQTLTLSSTKPTRSGYTFLGWSTSNSATSATYSSGGSYTTNSNVTLYAVWSANTYTVSYDANGGSGAPASQIKTYGQTLTLSSTKPTRSGYTFLGWSTSNSATSATYSSGGSYTTNSNVTLYAVWSANTYTVSYNANGGSGAPSSQTVTYGESVAISGVKPTKNDCVFLGWSTSSTATKATFEQGDYYATDSNVTLYAVWAKKITIGNTIVNINNAGDVITYNFTPSITGTYTIESIGSYDTYGNLYDCEFNELTYNDDDGDSTNFSISYRLEAGTTYLISTRMYSSSNTGSFTINISLKYCEITYDANGGNNAPDTQTVISGENAYLSTSIPSKSYKVYFYDDDNDYISDKDVECEFVEWYSNMGEYYQSGDIINTDENVTLYAQWNEPQIGMLPTPVKAGYTFNGWYLANGTRVYSTTSITQNTTIYAHWERSYYTVEYNANGGSGAPSSQNKYVGVTLTLSKSVPTREGYEFLGWSTSSTATSATYNAGANFTRESDTVLYAVWKLIPETTTEPIETTTQPSTTEEPTTLSEIIIPMPDGLFFMDNMLYWMGNDVADSYYVYVDGWLIGETTFESYYFDEGYLSEGYHDIFVTSVKNGKESEMAWIGVYIEYPEETTTELEVVTTEPQITTVAPETTTPVEPTETVTVEPTTQAPTTEPRTTFMETTTPELTTKKTYIIRYDANGGYGAPSSQTKTEGKKITLSEVKPKRTGYYFVGWNTNKYAGYEEYYAGSDFYVDSNVTLYAVWDKETEDDMVWNDDVDNIENPTLSNQKETQKIVKLSKPKIKKLINKRSKKLLVKWKKSKNVDGYIIQYYQAKKSKLKRTRRVGATKTSIVLKGFKKNKRYYVKIRTYKRVDSKLYYSKWSKSKSIKIKK